MGFVWNARLAKKEEIPQIKKWAISKRNKVCNFLFALKQPSNRIIITTLFERPIGIVIFDPEDYEIFIFLKPRMHGKGYGYPVLSQSLQWIERYYSNIDYVFAECGSLTSIKLFEKKGFISENPYSVERFYYF